MVVLCRDYVVMKLEWGDNGVGLGSDWGNNGCFWIDNGVITGVYGVGLG